MDSLCVPRCDRCDSMTRVRSERKGEGMRDCCGLTGRDVTQSCFGMNSPKDCPKRNGNEQAKEGAAE